jgi:putative tricarboxylic transport membrane protein
MLASAIRARLRRRGKGQHGNDVNIDVIRRAAGALIVLLSACAPSSPTGRYPSQPIELVVPFQAGGGSDTLARTIQTIVAEERLVPVPINVVNRTGGAGAIGLAYVASKAGDAHTLMTTIDTVLAVPLQPGYTGPSYRDLSIVSVLALDDMLVVVPGKSAYRTIEDLVARAKANPGKVTLATNAAGGEDHIFGGMIERATGARFTYVHTKGGAEAMQNVMGGHVDVAVPNPSETLGQLQGGLVRVLAVASAERLKVLPDVPTLKERGIDVEYRMFRGIAMPPGVPADVVAYWNGVLAKVTQSERWTRDYVRKLELTPQFKGPADALTFMASMEQAYRSTLKDLRVIE